MSMKTKKTQFSKEEKLQILKEAGKNGVRHTLEKYGVYPATYYYWKKKTEEMGEEGLTHSMTKKRLQKIKELEQENDLVFIFAAPNNFFG